MEREDALSDDQQQSGILGDAVPATAAETTGFEEPAAVTEPQAKTDPLVEIAETEHRVGLGKAVMVVAQRLLQVEDYLRRLNSDVIMPFQQAATNFDARVKRVEDIVQHMSQQRALAEIQMERQTRSMAIDLAIKSIAEDKRTPDAITTYADAYL